MVSTLLHEICEHRRSFLDLREAPCSSLASYLTPAPSPTLPAWASALISAAVDTCLRALFLLTPLPGR